MEKVNIKQKLDSFSETWVPKIVGELNGQHVKVVKFEDEYVWHHHEVEDELFLVVEGRMEIHLRDQIVALDPGEFFIVPRGVEHKPVVPEGLASILLFEPATTRNTGNVDHGLTIEAADLKKI
ncbi:MAG: cupin domain-containing protein [Acidobacteria bacterium]|nr:MAG: cupin domain-containing protein [Acidobacteriota bacterium]